MARFKPIKPPKTIEINEFLGLNEAIGETEIKLGESVFQENVRITQNFKPQKRPGMSHVINAPNQTVGNIWQGVVNNNNVIIVAIGTVGAYNLYELNLDIPTSENTFDNLLFGGWNDSGTWDDTDTWNDSENAPMKLLGPVQSVNNIYRFMGGQLHIKNSLEWLVYNGTTLGNLVPYVPTIALASPPLGGGTLFEEINLLTKRRKQEFTGNGTTIFQLAETDIGLETLFVTVNGVSAAHTVDRLLGKVTITSAPPTGAKVIIEWSSKIDNSSFILGCNGLVTSGVNNSGNAFHFGNPTFHERFYYSMLGDVSYYPVNSFVDVGSDGYKITDIVAQQQSILVFKRKGTKIIKPSENPFYTSNTGLNPYIYGYEDLNDLVGNEAFGGVQLVKDTPISLFGGSAWAWTITSVESQRSADIVSSRVRESMQAFDISQVTTFNYVSQTELWLIYEDTIIVFNYGNNTWYKYTQMPLKGESFDYNGAVYSNYNNESVVKISQDIKSDLGLSIPCEMKLGFTDFGALQYVKTMRDIWASIAPMPKTSVKITFATDSKLEEESKEYTIVYRYLNFNEVDFNDFTFLTSKNPQPSKVDVKVKKFTYLQTVFKNNTTDEGFTVLKIIMSPQVQGYS